jgi:hypothetical protein
MIKLTIPAYSFKLKQEGTQQFIFDAIRKKYVVLTQEEWVRQHMVTYLIEAMQYPKGLFSVEKTIVINKLRKRYDIVVYYTDHQPWMLIECKELMRYHQFLQCPYWMLTNGLEHYCAAVNKDGVQWLSALPLHNDRILGTI